MDNNIDNRQMPVFISSTFLDMQEERDWLIKRTFPRLKEIALKRMVILSQVDLRWGVTSRDAENGLVMELCLHEIERCLPFFIGLIGDRYGWCPSFSELRKNSYLLDRYEWLKKDLEEGLSATEIEMQFAVLRKLHPVYAFFFIKKDRQRDEQAEDNIQQLIRSIISNGQEFTINSEELNHLSDEHGYYSFYSSVEELGKLVESAMLKLLDTLFPISEKEDEWFREKRAQEAYLRELCDIYVPQACNKWIEYSLDQMKDRYYMITSDEDCFYGKSAFVANWLNERIKEGSRNYIYHFIEAGYLGGNCRRILERLCIEVANLYGLPFLKDEIKDNTDFSFILSGLLQQVAGQKPLFIVLDGLQYFSGDKMLEWLPLVPDNVCLIITDPIHDGAVEVFRRRFDSTLSLGNFREDEVRMFISEYLGKFGKSLSEPQVDTLLASYESAQPAPNGMKDIMTLKILLYELVIFGSYEELDKRIAYYTENNLKLFYQRSLERIEKDCGQDLVRLVLGLITYSRRGLSEEEIMDVTKITMLQWSNIRYSISHLLILKDGRYCVGKFAIAMQVDSRYHTVSRQLRQQLINYFSIKEDLRSIEECLFQYYHLENFNSLYHTLLDLDVFSHLYENNVEELFSYWKELYRVGEKSKYSIGNYANLEVPATTKNAQTLAEIGRYSKFMLGDEHSAKILFYKSKEIFEFIPHNDYDTLAMVYSELDMLDEAESSLDKILGLTEFMHDESNTSDTYFPNLLSFKGSLLFKMDKRDEAIEVFKRVLQLILPLKGENNTAVLEIYRNLSLSYHYLKEYDTAIDYIEKSLVVIGKVWGERHMYMAETLSLYAVVHNNLGHYIEAINFFRKALEIYRKWLPNNHPKILKINDAIDGLQIKLKKPQKTRIFDVLFCKLRTKENNYPLSDEEFMETINFFEGIVDDLYVYDEGWEDGKKEYDYTFKHTHDCIVGNNRYIFGSGDNIYIYVGSSGMYESGDRTFENLKDAQVHYLFRLYPFYEQYCDYIDSKYIPYESLL